MATSKSKGKGKAATKTKAAKAPTQKKPGKSKRASVDASEGEATASGAQRWKGMSIAELQQLYVRTLGRPTSSNDRTYLIWKIREAEKGNVPVGPGTRKLFDGPTSMVTVKLEDAFLDKLDEAGKEDGFTSRLGYMRDLMAKGLQARGRSELAAMVAV